MTGTNSNGKTAKWNDMHFYFAELTCSLASYSFAFMANAACDERLRSNGDGINLRYIRIPEWNIVCMRDTQKFESPMKMAFYELQCKQFLNQNTWVWDVHKLLTIIISRSFPCGPGKKLFSSTNVFESRTPEPKRFNFFSSFEQRQGIAVAFTTFIFLCVVWCDKVMRAIETPPLEQ